MRAKDFLKEGSVGSLQDDVADALPATYVIPKLQNTDPYKQYRFGLALAAAKGAKDRASENDQSFEPTSPWGENAVVVGYGNDLGDYIDDALSMVGLTAGDKKLISTPTSKESTDVVKGSPVPSRKTNKYGV